MTGMGVRIAVLVVLAAGAAGSAWAADSASGTITADGSSTVYPITEAVGEEFQKANPKIRVTIGISGTGGGFKKFCSGETDLSDASRPIKPTEVELCQQNKVEYVELAGQGHMWGHKASINETIWKFFSANPRTLK